MIKLEGNFTKIYNVICDFKTDTLRPWFYKR